MFEGSLVESRGLVVSRTQRWTALGSLTVQLAVAGLLLAIPLMRPEVLPPFMVAPHVELPVPIKPSVVQRVQTATAAASTGMSVPAVNVATAVAPRLVFSGPGEAVEEPAPAFDPTLRMGGGGTGLPGDLPAIVAGPAPNIVAMKPKPQRPLPVSRGVTEGMLLTPIRPVYPPIAVAARVQGSVVMEAVISKTGAIESLRAVSGPEMLRGAAMTAVQAARYRPYLLSGEPTEVQTTVTVVFTLGS